MSDAVKDGVRDREAIVVGALALASAEEREAYLAEACGADAALRAQVLDLIAAHFRATLTSPAVVKPLVGVNGAQHHAPQATNHNAETYRFPEQAGAAREAALEPTPERSPNAADDRAHAWKTPVILMLLGTTVVSALFAVMSSHAKNEARAEAEKAIVERDEAVRAEADLKTQRAQAEEALKVAVAEREQAGKQSAAAAASVGDATAVLSYLRDTVFAAAHPKNAWGDEPKKNLTLRQALAVAETRVEKEFTDQPLREAAVREIVGSTCADLGESEAAVTHYERALILRESCSGENDPHTVDCRNQLAVAYRLAGRTGDAARLFDSRAESPLRASVLAARGAALVLQKKLTDAERSLRESVALSQRLHQEDWSTLETKSLLGHVLSAQQKYAAAEPLLLTAHNGLKAQPEKIPPHKRNCLVHSAERLVGLYGAWHKSAEESKWRKELAIVTGATK